MVIKLGSECQNACSVSKSLPTTHPGSLVEEQPATSWVEVVQVAAEPVAVGRTPGQELLRELEAELEAEAAAGAVRPGTPGSEVRLDWCRARAVYVEGSSATGTILPRICGVENRLEVVRIHLMARGCTVTVSHVHELVPMTWGRGLPRSPSRSCHVEAQVRRGLDKHLL